jgi:hypothetical protein
MPTKRLTCYMALRLDVTTVPTLVVVLASVANAGE